MLTPSKLSERFRFFENFVFDDPKFYPKSKYQILAENKNRANHKLFGRLTWLNFYDQIEILSIYNPPGSSRNFKIHISKKMMLFLLYVLQWYICCCFPDNGAILLVKMILLFLTFEPFLTGKTRKNRKFRTFSSAKKVLKCAQTKYWYR